MVFEAFKTNGINYYTTKATYEQCLPKFGTQATPIPIARKAHYANFQAPPKRENQNL